MSLKSLRERLCDWQSKDSGESPEVVQAYVNHLIRMIDDFRPLGPDGTHGDRHTPHCGCDVGGTK